MQALVVVLPLCSSISYADCARVWARMLRVYRVVLEWYSLLQHRVFCAAAPFCQPQ